MSLAGKRVLVTGAGGFIGSHLTAALVRVGAQARALVHYNSQGSRGHLERLPADVLEEIDVLAGDVRDSQRVRQAVEGCDVVLHLAALIGIPYSSLAPESYVQVNVLGTLNVLTACREAGIDMLVQTSTSEVYGTPLQVPIDETHRLHAQSPYAATKVAADQLALSFHANFGLPVVVARPFNTFGPRQSARAVIPTIVTQALAGQPVRLGNTETIRDFVYVDDTVAGFLAAAVSRPAIGQVVQLSTGVGVSIAGVVHRVESLLGQRLTVEHAAERRRPDSGEVQRLIGCAVKARQLLGWQAEVDFDEGLRRTIEWLAANRDLYQTSQYCV